MCFDSRREPAPCAKTLSRSAKRYNKLREAFNRLQKLLRSGSRRKLLKICRHFRVIRTSSRGALLNLVSNAIKYSARGSEVKLRAGINANGEGVVLEVWNPGPTIPPGELARLFEPFYRRSEREETVRGWGLGLAFVKRIAEQHGGKAEALSESGSGTSF